MIVCISGYSNDNSHRTNGGWSAACGITTDSSPVVSLPSGARDVMGRRKAKERETTGKPCVEKLCEAIFLWFNAVRSLFPSHHPLLPPRALRWDDWERIRHNYQKQHRGRTSTHAPGWAFPVTVSFILSNHSLPRALGFILCAAGGSVVVLHAARVFDYFLVIEIAFMDNQAQITETISRLDSEKVSW